MAIGHLAIDPDGSRRNQKEKAPGEVGIISPHIQGGELMKEVVLPIVFGKFKIKELSTLLFSREDREDPLRSEDEISMLFELIQKFLEKFASSANEKGIKIQHIGDTKWLEEKYLDLLSTIQKAVNTTADCHKHVWNICIDYRGNEEENNHPDAVIKTGTNNGRINSAFLRDLPKEVPAKLLTKNFSELTADKLEEVIEEVSQKVESQISDRVKTG
jgi:undecaprenyl diphosphate synthase